MNPELKQKWVEALRSGKYKQAQGVLRDKSDQFCCLGVLCDLVGVAWRESDAAYLADGHRATLPFQIRETSGLDHMNEQKLMNLNDGGRSFRTIADYIEKNL